MSTCYLLAPGQEPGQSVNDAIAEFLLAQQRETWYKLLQCCDLQYRDEELILTCRSIALAKAIESQGNAIAKPLNINLRLVAPGYEAFL